MLEDVKELYAVLVVFQSKALGFVAKGEDAQERLARANAIASVIEEAQILEFQQTKVSFSIGPVCEAPLVDCNGQCLPEEMCVMSLTHTGQADAQE